MNPKDVHLALGVLVAACCLLVVTACGNSEPSEASILEPATIANADANVTGDAHDDDDEHDDEGHDDEEHDDNEGANGFGTHVHGAAELFVAWSDGSVVVDLISPANNIFGFERVPTSDEDMSIAADRSAALAAPSMLMFNAGAQCRVTNDPEPELVVEGSHAELTTTWLFTCDNADAIESLDLTPIFSEFPGIVDVDAQWASEVQQSAAELTPTSTTLRFG